MKDEEVTRITKERRKKPTIKEIAQLTGFSPSTVSLVLNNKGSFSEATRSAINLAYEALNPTGVAAKDKGFIRLLIEESEALFATDPYNSEIIKGIESECRARGYEMMLSFVREDNEPDEWLEGASGLILLGGGLITDALVMSLRDAGIPLILVDNYVHSGDCPSVHSDHYGAGFLATQYLIRRGHRKIGFISGPTKYKPLVDRYAGYCAALMEHGIPLRADYVSQNIDRKYVKGYFEMKYLMELEDRPTAVFAVSDRSALGAVQAMEEMGIALGQDVELIGCDNIPAVRDISPGIATVHIPRWETGQMAVRFLLEAIKGNQWSGKVVLPGKLIEPC